MSGQNVLTKPSEGIGTDTRVWVSSVTPLWPSIGRAFKGTAKNVAKTAAERAAQTVAEKAGQKVGEIAVEKGLKKSGKYCGSASRNQRRCRRTSK